MPFWSYKNVNDPEDILVDEIFSSVSERPETIQRNGQVYKFHPIYPSSEIIFKGSGWTPTNKVAYISEEDREYLKKTKRWKQDLNDKKESLRRKIKNG
jgi:predicted nucleic acid-binding Zn ribbon protein